jgi:predicted transcriptional regulator
MMEPESPHRLETSVRPYKIKRIERQDAIDFLIDLNKLRWLQPFMVGECTMAQVAQALGEDLSLLSRQVQRMLKMGLIEVTHIETRKGRAIKHYPASADEFFIPEGTGATMKASRLNGMRMSEQLQMSILNAFMH